MRHRAVLQGEQWAALGLPIGLVNCLKEAAKKPAQNAMAAAPRQRAREELDLEGYTIDHSHLPLSKMREQGDVVQLNGVGGAMLLVRADLHREGVMFPSFPYQHRIETEGLSMVALDAGYKSWGMPNVEVIHL